MTRTAQARAGAAGSTTPQHDSIGRATGRSFSGANGRAWLLVAAALLLTSLAGCGRLYRADPATEDSYSVTLIITPEQPAMGPSTLFVGLKNPAGQPVDGARLEIEANMSHAGMVPVLASTTESHDGLYRVPLTWTMSGDWYVDVVFTLPDGSRIARRYPVGVK